MLKSPAIPTMKLQVYYDPWLLAQEITADPDRVIYHLKRKIRRLEAEIQRLNHIIDDQVADQLHLTQFIEHTLKQRENPRSR